MLRLLTFACLLLAVPVLCVLGSWLVLDSEPGDVFSDEPDELWRTVLRRQPGRLAWLADAPDDLSAN